MKVRRKPGPVVWAVQVTKGQPLPPGVEVNKMGIMFFAGSMGHQVVDFGDWVILRGEDPQLVQREEFTSLFEIAPDDED